MTAALEWAIDNENADLALEMVGNLWRFWQARGHLVDAEGRIGKVLTLEGGEPWSRAMALEAQGGVAYWKGDWGAARGPYQEALVLLRMHGDPTQIANALYNLSFPVTYMGATGQAIDYLTESPSIAEDIDDRLGIGRAYWGFCFVATMAKDYEDTIPHAERAAAEFELLDSPFDLGWTRFMLAQTHYLLGNSDGARQYVDMAIPLFVTTRDLAAVVLSLYLNVAITISEGDENRAALMLGAAKTLKLRTGATIADVEQNQYEDVTTLMNDSRTGIQEAIEAGRRMTTEQAMALAATV